MVVGRIAYPYFLVCESKEDSQCILTPLKFINLGNLRATCKHSCYTAIYYNYKLSSGGCSWLLGIKLIHYRRKGIKSYHIFHTVFQLLEGPPSPSLLLAASREAGSCRTEIGICLQDGGQSACFHVPKC